MRILEWHRLLNADQLQCHMTQIMDARFLPKILYRHYTTCALLAIQN